MLRHTFEPIDNPRLAHLCGALDEHLRTIEIALDVRIARREASFSVDGERGAAERTLALLKSLYERPARRPARPHAEPAGLPAEHPRA